MVALPDNSCHIFPHSWPPIVFLEFRNCCRDTWMRIYIRAMSDTDDRIPFYWRHVDEVSFIDDIFYQSETIFFIECLLEKVFRVLVSIAGNPIQFNKWLDHVDRTVQIWINRIIHRCSTQAIDITVFVSFCIYSLIIKLAENNGPTLWSSWVWSSLIEYTQRAMVYQNLEVLT